MFRYVKVNKASHPPSLKTLLTSNPLSWYQKRERVGGASVYNFLQSGKLIILIPDLFAGWLDRCPTLKGFQKPSAVQAAKRWTAAKTGAPYGDHVMYAFTHFVSLPERVFLPSDMCYFQFNWVRAFFNVTSCCVSSKAANIEFVISTPLNFVLVQSPFWGRRKYVIIILVH